MSKDIPFETDKDDDIKSVISGKLKDSYKEITPEMSQQLEILLAEIKKLDKYEISFLELHELTNYDYKLLNDLIFYGIIQKKIIGFVDSKDTPDLSDDILILREKRYLDTNEFREFAAEEDE